METLPPEFYLRPTLQVARDLLGKVVVRRWNGRRLSGRIVEVEAYHQREAAAHSYGGPTARNRAMFARGGTLYVYLIYGIHHCMNVVTEAEGVGAAVLIRALEPLEGADLMRAHRGDIDRRVAWTNGPGKLCQALRIDRALDGLLLAGPEVALAEGPGPGRGRIGRSPRIGISKAAELEWRFFEKDNPYVSR